MVNIRYWAAMVPKNNSPLILDAKSAYNNFENYPKNGFAYIKILMSTTI